MNKQLQRVIVSQPLAPTAQLTPPLLLAAWLKGQDSDDTRRAYKTSIEQFAKYLKAPSADVAVRLLVTMESGGVHAIVDAWRAALRDTVAPSTVNLRLTALRNLVAAAKRYGLVDWKLEVDNVEAKAYRDTRGPGHEGYLGMRKAAAGETPQAKRDTAMLRLLHDTALRSKEVLGLQMTDVDRQGMRIWITGKGKTQREAITLPPGTLKALCDWIDARGDAAGFVFCRLDRGVSRTPGFDKPVSHVTLWTLVRKYGKAAGVEKARPHGLRHQGITRAAELLNGDLVAVAAYSRHAKLDTVKIYVDNAKDRAGDVARRVAGDD